MTESTRYQLIEMTETASSRWDDIVSTYQGAQLFHRRAWLDYLAASREVDIRLWSVADQDQTVGVFCAGVVRKGPFRVLGSPLKGWGTNSMGPVIQPGAQADVFLRALDDLATRERIAMTEIESPAIPDHDLSAAGYQPVRSWTYVVLLTPGDESAMWQSLDSTARNRIRKAMRSGVTIEDSDDDLIADEFYEQYTALLKQKGLAPPYPPEYARLLIQHLRKADLLFALRVRDAAGRVIATGLFPHDDASMYFWGGASWLDARHFCPNEFLHWSAMCLAAKRGLRRYDMSGYGRFKKKFGGELVTLKRWHKAYWRSAGWARKTYEFYHQSRRHIGGLLPSTPPDPDRTARRRRPHYELEPLTTDELARWDDLVAGFGSRQLFHYGVWLEYLARSRGVEPRFWALRRGGRTDGYFCGAVVRKGPFRILGSPLKGWGTNYMGPVVNEDLDQEAFLRAVDALARESKLAMVEVENPILSGAAMEEAGYVGVAQPTYIVELTPADPDRMWRRIDIKSRQKIKKAKKLGLVVEEVDDPRIAEDFYDQFVQVLARKNLFPPYGPDAPRLLFELLRPRDMLLALQIRDASGTIVATGLFPHDDRTIYFWGGASRMSSWNLSPNDLMQWAAMEKAAARGLQVYNMCGYGYFKSKFGGVLEQPHRWHKSYSTPAKWARDAYALYFQKQIKLRGWWQRVTQHAPGGQQDQGGD
jgi:lipid II:glycine glycyltransferase (peptidoglycan interpeptide bridge formation enzyme)